MKFMVTSCLLYISSSFSADLTMQVNFHTTSSTPNVATSSQCREQFLVWIFPRRFDKEGIFFILSMSCPAFFSSSSSWTPDYAHHRLMECGLTLLYLNYNNYYVYWLFLQIGTTQLFKRTKAGWLIINHGTRKSCMGSWHTDPHLYYRLTYLGMGWKLWW